MYSIGEVSEMFDLPVSTLRYYDKEGLFPDMMRVSGIRKFSDRELETLRVIECLKKSGMEIKDIRQFIEWCAMGKETYPQRRAMFQRQRQNIAFFKMMFRFLKHIPLNGTLPTDFPQNAFLIFLKQHFRCVLS